MRYNHIYMSDVGPLPHKLLPHLECLGVSSASTILIGLVRVLQNALSVLHVQAYTCSNPYIDSSCAEIRNLLGVVSSLVRLKIRFSSPHSFSDLNSRFVDLSIAIGPLFDVRTLEGSAHIMWNRGHGLTSQHRSYNRNFIASAAGGEERGASSFSFEVSVPNADCTVTQLGKVVSVFASLIMFSKC